MLKVILFHPQSWKYYGHWDYGNHTPNNNGLWRNIQYYINDFSIKDPEYIVVHENLDAEISVNVPNGNTIFVTGEEKTHKKYPESFLQQFDMIITSRDDLEHSNIIRTNYLHPWQVKRTFDQLISTKSVFKQKGLSAVVSNLQFSNEHHKRYKFIKAVSEHFGDRLDWYDKDKNLVEDKWDGLAPYKYSIAIENSFHKNYFTEKITDCFLSFTMPLYIGCTNISDFFDERSFILLDIDDINLSIKKIENLFKEDPYESRLKYIIESRNLVLEKYHFIAGVSNIIEVINLSNKEARRQRKIKPQHFFEKKSLFKKISNSIHLFR